MTWFDRPEGLRVPWKRPATPVQLNYGLMQLGLAMWMIPDQRMKSRVGCCW